MEKKRKVAFLCSENSCRSQIAEAIARQLASDAMEVFSAGTVPAREIDPGAVRMVREIYGIDIYAQGQRPKVISELPDMDVIIYMGCRVECAKHPCRIALDWGISDPKGKPDEAYRNAVSEIEKNILLLREDILSGRIDQWSKENFVVSFSSAFPFWDDLTFEQREQIRTGWRTELFPKKKQIYNTSDDCKGVMIIQKGCLRVYMLSPQGREVSLYRLFPGDVCVLSASCLIEELDFDILIEAEDYTEVATIPAADIQKIVAENREFENFLYKKTAERFSSVMWTVQQILFKRIDQRIAQYLWEEMNRNHTDYVQATHDQIAREIYSAREVVSKTLRHMAEDGVIRIRYGRIEVADRAALCALF